MLIETVVVTPFEQNARLIVDEKTKEALVVDPGGDVERIVRLIANNQVTVKQILLTHAHIDHAGGVRRLVQALQQENERPLLLAHPEEKLMRQSIAKQALMFGLPQLEYEDVPEPEVYVDDGDTVSVGSLSGRVLFTPGHSPGHVSLFFAEEQTNPPVLIAGDTLFAGSIGRTDLPGGDFRVLLRSIKEKILTLPGATRVLPGHGPDTTVHVERRTNPFLQPGY